MKFNKEFDEIKTITEEIKKIAGDKTAEISEVTKKLAEIDLRLEHAIEELEKLDGDDVVQHNELSEKLDELINEVVEEKNKEKEPEETDEPEEPEPKEKPKVKRCEVRVIIAAKPVMPFPFFFPFMF